MRPIFRVVAIIAAAASILSTAAPAHAKKKPLPPLPPATDAARIICWMADGDGMQPTGDLETFIADRLGATGTRVAVDPGIAHSILRVLGVQNRSVFDPSAARRLAVAADARWVLWVKIVDRDMQSKKLLSVPYLFNHRRLDAHVFFDVRVYDAQLDQVAGSNRLRLSDRGEGTWQVTEDERLDPAYNNDPVEIHERYRRLDWRAAALISGYCADVLHPERLAKLAEQAAKGARTNAQAPPPPSATAVQTAVQPD